MCLPPKQRNKRWDWFIQCLNCSEWKQTGSRKLVRLLSSCVRPAKAHGKNVIKYWSEMCQNQKHIDQYRKTDSEWDHLLMRKNVEKIDPLTNGKRRAFDIWLHEGLSITWHFYINFYLQKRKIHQELMASTNKSQTKTSIISNCKREISNWTMPMLSATLVLYPRMS